MKTKRVLAIIPARQGSKRIPLKNRKSFAGRPLIHWTMLAALDCKDLITHIVVTTNDSSILEMHEQFPEIEFIKRPHSLAADETSTYDVVEHVMQQQLEKFDAILLLQPTSPLRTSKHLREAITAYSRGHKPQLVSVKKSLQKVKNTIAETSNGDFLVLNGAIYISDWDYLTLNKFFSSPHSQMFEMDAISSVDIDTPEDWDQALNLFKNRTV
jgi:CMP-N,N'-diacetyllegionaminic acid synthase